MLLVERVCYISKEIKIIKQIMMTFVILPFTVYSNRKSEEGSLVLSIALSNQAGERNEREMPVMEPSFFFGPTQECSAKPC